MARKTIPSDSTFQSIVPSLENPAKQVRQVVEIMAPLHRAKGNAHVRIGVTGEGKSPYYKVFSIAPSGAQDILGTFYGPSRQDDSYEPQDGAWSSASSSFEEMQQLLGQIRGFGRR